MSNFEVNLRHVNFGVSKRLLQMWGWNSVFSRVDCVSMSKDMRSDERPFPPLGVLTVGILNTRILRGSLGDLPYYFTTNMIALSSRKEVWTFTHTMGLGAFHVQPD